MRRYAGLGVAVVVLSGCFRWTPVGALPRTGDLPDDLRVTKWDSSQVRLSWSRIESDTIRGIVDGTTQRVEIPLAAVDLIERRELLRGKTAVAIVAATGGILWLTKILADSEPLGSIPGVP
jgi:hypothetical protein